MLAKFAVPAVLTFVGVVGADPLLAQQQLRFAVAPAAGDATWSTPGITFEKQGSCSFSTSVRPVTIWPVPAAEDAGSATARAPLFNPGLLTPAGTYDTSKPDDGFNTLFVPVPLKPGAATFVCRGAILANGTDVTLSARDVTVAATLGSIAQTGPLTVSVALDPAKLAAVVTPKAVVKFAERPIQAIRKSSYGTIHWQKRWDLDSSTEVAASNPTADLDMYVSASKTIAVPYNGALISAGVPYKALPDNVKNQRYDYCVAAKKTTTYVVNPKGWDSLYACVLTNDGRIVLLIIPGTTDGGYAGGLYVPFDYVVWEK